MAKDKKPQRPASVSTKPGTAATKTTRTEQRQQERQTELRRRRLTVTAIAVGAIVLLAVIVLVTGNIPAEAPIPETASRYDGLTQTMNERGYPRIGDLDGIPVSLFTAFGCTECNTFHNTVLPQLIERVRTGEISLTYIPLRAGIVSNFNGATRSALCAGRQSAFFPYADALVQWTADYGNGAFADNRLTTGAANLGLDQGAFGGCRRGAPENAVFEQALIDLGGRDTQLVPPVVFVNNVIVNTTEGDASAAIEDINAAIDAAIDFRTGTDDDDTTPEPTAEIEPTAEATSDAATEAPTDEPTAGATDEPTSEASAEPTAAPTEDSDVPTVEPTETGG